MTREEKIAEIVRQHCGRYAKLIRLTNDRRRGWVAQKVEAACNAAWDAALEHAAMRAEDYGQAALCSEPESARVIGEMVQRVCQHLAAALRREAHTK